MVSGSRARVLVLYIRYEAQFIKKDIEILRQEFDVKVVKVKPLTYFLLPFLVARCDLVFSWFGDLHAAVGTFWAKLLGKKSVVVAGGYDVVEMPEINYGLQLRLLGRIYSRWAFRRADLVIPISKSIATDLEKVVALPPERVRLIYHGFDGKKYRREAGIPKKEMVLSVGEVNISNLARKGLLAVAEASRIAPHLPWIVAGPITDVGAAERMRREGGATLVLRGWVSEEELIQQMSRAKVYVQPSAHEGFALSLAEAMLCECVPVVSNRGALPEVVGDAGIVLEKCDAPKVVEAVARAMKLDGRRARERILGLYPLSARREKLLQAVQGLLAET